MRGLKDRTVLVTGAANGIGAAIARRLAQEGCSVGIVDLDAMRAALGPDVALVSLMLANNETGMLQPVAEVAKLARAHGARIHTDAVQAVGKLPVDVAALDVDLLSLAGQQTWTEQYTSNRIGYATSELLPRIGIWLGGVFPVMATLVAWPLAREPLAPGIARRLALIAGAGLILSLGCAAWYFSVLDSALRGAILAPSCRAWQAAIVLGIILQAAAWVLVWRAAALLSLPRWLALAGAVLSVSGGAVCREALRTSRLDFAGLLPQHEAAATVGGFWLFALFLVLNFAIIAGCIALVARSLKSQ